MRKVLTVLLVVALVSAAAVLAAVASARPASAKQRVVIENKGDSFVLTPTSPGVRPDRGAFAACCWTSRHVVVAGQRLELDNPRLTLTGRNGTLELRNRIAWVDVPDKWAIFTGTWKVIGGTGAYSRLSGHGQVFGAETPGGYDRVRFFGFLTPR